MIDQLHKDDQETIALKKYILKLLKLGKSSLDVKQLLVKNGLQEQKAYAMVNEIEEIYINKSKKGGGTFSLVLGFVMLAAGIGITFSDEGIVAYGVMIVGAIYILKGIDQFRRA